MFAGTDRQRIHLNTYSTMMLSAVVMGADGVHSPSNSGFCACNPAMFKHMFRMHLDR